MDIELVTYFFFLSRARQSQISTELELDPERKYLLKKYLLTPPMNEQ
jgi:hypothetical protein